MEFFKLIKSKEYLIKKQAAKLDWNLVSYGKDYYGNKYNLKQLANGKINSQIPGKLNEEISKEDIIVSVDLYDKKGNLLSKSEDYL